jgi:hypothetical protein
MGYTGKFVFLWQIFALQAIFGEQVKFVNTATDVYAFVSSN